MGQDRGPPDGPGAARVQGARAATSLRAVVRADPRTPRGIARSRRRETPSQSTSRGGPRLAVAESHTEVLYMIRTATLGLLTALALATPTVALAAPQQPVATQVAAAPAAPAKAAAAETSSYAEREQQDKQVADYEGGSVVVVGISSGTLIVLLLVLLLI